MQKYQKLEDPYFVKYIYELCGRDDEFINRAIIVTPYFGASSKPAGFVITVQGTPIKATIYLPLGSYRAIVNANPVKVIPFNDDYGQLIDFLKRNEIDKIYDVGLY